MIRPSYRYFVVTDPASVSNPADSFYYAHRYEQAIDAYILLIAKEGSGNDLLFNLAGSYALAGKKDSALARLKELADKGFFNIDYFQQNPDFISLHGLPLWKKIETQILSNLKKYEKKEGIQFPQIRHQLLNLSTNDQFTDHILFLQRAYNAYSQYDISCLRTNKAYVYKHGAQVIRQLTKRYGVLGKSKVGKDGAEAYWTIVQHADADLAMQGQILALIAEATKNDEFTRTQLAFLTDRVLKNKQEPQLYGTQFWKNPNSGKWEMYTLKDPEQVNERRKEMGLSTLEESIRTRIH
ncbi:MAG: DUF6624 domain-containing protein [Bacteroidota bacterium]